MLDIGCGDGRNAIYLAEQGLRVDAFDVSTLGVAKCRKRAVARGLSVRAWVQDVGTFVFRREYDLVVAHGDEHPGGVRHAHPVNKVVAQKAR